MSVKVKLFCALLLAAALGGPASGGSGKLRVLVLTDIENEPDDAMSMVRFLTYANHWDVEGLIATTSTHQRDKIADWRIREIVAAYGKVRDNLLLHEPGYPEESYLQGIIKRGYPGYGMTAVGPGKDSEGSEWIVSMAGREDERPLWILVWGGSNCLAQALWKVRMTRPPEELERLVAKLRVYTISDQDDSGPWLRATFPGLFYIVSPGPHGRGAYHYATWSGISGDRMHGFGGADFSLVDNPWLDKHIRQNHGPLGAEHPHTEFLMEGDSPSFLFLVDNGLGDPERPDFGSWGGRYEYYTPRTRKWFYGPETRPIWTDTEDEVTGDDGKLHNTNKATIWRWREAYQNDFAARIDWTVQPFDGANHPPVAALDHPAGLTVRSGEKVALGAAASSDPDGDGLLFNWFVYREAGSYESNRPLQINNKQEKEAWFTAPAVGQPETLHIILAVTDQGIPALTRYRRVIVSVLPKQE